MFFFFSFWFCKKIDRFLWRFKWQRMLWMLKMVVSPRARKVWKKKKQIWRFSNALYVHENTLWPVSRCDLTKRQCNFEVKLFRLFSFSKQNIGYDRFAGIDFQYVCMHRLTQNIAHCERVKKDIMKNVCNVTRMANFHRVYCTLTHRADDG